MRTVFAAGLLVTIATPALAAPGDPVKVEGGLALDPIIDARLRYEGVDTPTLDADALTLRVRAGVEVRHKSGFGALIEGEGTLPIVASYNAFPFAIADSQRRTGFAVVPDPGNVELNRVQLQYRSKAVTVTVGRQRINLDDHRFVGAVGWRQNEQTFDAVRGEAKFGPISLDATYAFSQRTLWGIEGGPRSAFDGDFVFMGAGTRLGPVSVKGFAYLLDYDPAEQAGALATSNADTQTYGLRATAAFKLSPKAALGLTASYARQSEWQDNPADYGVDYILAEGVLSFGPISLTAGYEKLGSNGSRAVQTPMATLHKFNGWADLFLTTPAAGLEDWHGGAAIKFPKVKSLPGLNAAVTFHRFESATGGLHYGDEWNASLGFKLGRVGVLVKVADYRADLFGVDTRKVWVQFELGF